MTRLLRFISITSLSMLVFCISAIVLGKTQPPPVLIPDVSNCGAVFCYLGVAPGLTPATYAHTILKTVPRLSRGDTVNRWLQTVSSPFYTVWIYPNSKNIVGQIELYFSETRLDAGSIVAQFGVPCRIVPLGSDHVILVYPKGSFSFRTENNLLVPHSALTVMKLYGLADAPCDVVENVLSYQWVGFRQYPAMNLD